MCCYDMYVAPHHQAQHAYDRTCVRDVWSYLYTPLTLCCILYVVSRYTVMLYNPPRWMSVCVFCVYTDIHTLT